MDALTTNEVAALFDLDERRVRKEVEHGVIDVATPPRFVLSAVVYLRTVLQMGIEVSAVDDRKRIYSLIVEKLKRLKGTESLTIELSPIAELTLHFRDIEDIVERFEAWKRRLVADERILGGEPVFPNSRLAVRHVGGMLLRGASPEDIREDYPYLAKDDIAFAKMYARAYPRLGRPRERETTDR